MAKVGALAGGESVPTGLVWPSPEAARISVGRAGRICFLESLVQGLGHSTVFGLRILGLKWLKKSFALLPPSLLGSSGAFKPRLLPQTRSGSVLIS